MTLVLSATLTAVVATRAASLALLAISRMLAPISSAPVATVATFLLTCSAAAEATLAWAAVSSAFEAICWLTSVSSIADLPSASAFLATFSINAWSPFLISTSAVISVEYFTILNGRPLRSRIGL